MIDGFKIIGGQALEGEVSISGSKNAALPIIAACLIEEGEYILENVPELRDIRTMFKLLKEMGLFVEKLEENKYKVTNNGINNIEAPYDLVKTMRASFLVMGPLLASKQRAKVSLPGGCAIGARPVNYHLKGFEELGCTINIKHGYVEAICEKLTGDKIVFEFPSVGATENLIMAAVKASGTTILENCAKEPEIEDLCNFLIKMGADISGVGTSTLKIKGKEKLNSCNYKILADRIEAGTFIIASILANGKIKVKDFELSHLDSFLQKLEEMGIEFEGDNNGFSAKIKNKLKSTRISTMPYPGFPTDLQAQMTILMCLAGGTSEVKENIFENRYMHIPELNRMGAEINVDGKIAIVKGVDKFYSAEVMASDLRAGASLVLAALLAEGETIINRIYHIDRGYEKLEEKLKGIGARIERIKLGVN